MILNTPKSQPHEITLQARSHERNAESKQLQKLHETLSKKLARKEMFVFPGSPIRVA